MQRKCDGEFERKVFELAILFARMWEVAETLETLPNRKQEAEDMLKEINGKMPDGVPEEFRKYFEDNAEEEAKELRDEIRKELVLREKELKERNDI